MRALINPYALLAALLVALGLLAGGYRWGASATENAWLARQAADERKAQARLQAERDRVDALVSQYLNDVLDRNESYAQLAASHDDLLRRAPLVVARPVAVATACHAGGAAAQPVAIAAAPEPAPAAQAAALGSDLHLTLAAVRVWNGALTGADAPAGACGAAGATTDADAACADSAGLTLRDAWDNHAANARSCAEDRARQQALIDFLTEK